LPFDLDRDLLRSTCESAVDLPVVRTDDSYVIFDGGGVHVEPDFLEAGQLHTVAISRPS
jgi:hypothetical protein